MNPVIVVYGEGDPKKHSVRYKPLEAGNVLVDKLGDLYISRDILEEIGATEKSRVRVTYEVMP